jgi:hypothetical protein
MLREEARGRIVEPIEYLEVGSGRTNRRVVLDGDRVTIGRSATNDVALPDDPSSSRAHAIIERLPTGWVLRDLGSRNGTLVNGRRIWTESVLHPGDEIRIGEALLTFRRTPSGAEEDTTVSGRGAPDLTRREREVLLVLCRPAATGEVFTEPASIREIARALFVTDAAVKQHLTRMYEKFGIRDDDGERRRVRLANEAIRRGVVTPADLRAPG